MTYSIGFSVIKYTEGFMDYDGTSEFDRDVPEVVAHYITSRPRALLPLE
jgi:hypothetical protein